MIKFKKNTKGYTLIELLAVITILIVITTVISGVIASTLRGSTKTRINTSVAQNGEYVKTIVSNIIADSRNVTAVDGVEIDDCAGSTPPSSSSSITLKRIDGGSTVLSCENFNGVGVIASNGASLIADSNVKVNSCTFSCSQVVSDPYSIPIVNVSFTISEKNTAQYEANSQSSFNISSSLRVYSP